MQSAHVRTYINRERNFFHLFVSLEVAVVDFAKAAFLWTILVLGTVHNSSCFSQVVSLNI